MKHSLIIYALAARAFAQQPEANDSSKEIEQIRQATFGGDLRAELHRKRLEWIARLDISGVGPEVVLVLEKPWKSRDGLLRTIYLQTNLKAQVIQIHQERPQISDSDLLRRIEYKSCEAARTDPEVGGRFHEFERIHVGAANEQAIVLDSLFYDLQVEGNANSLRLLVLDTDSSGTRQLTSWIRRTLATLRRTCKDIPDPGRW